MKKIITAISNPELNNKIIETKEFIVAEKDILYQDAVLELLEKDKEIEILILSEKLDGKLNLEEFINEINKINNNLEIFIILEKENKEKINLLKNKKINNIFFNNKTTINEIINSLKNIKTEYIIEEEIKEIKKLILENNYKKENKIKINKIINKNKLIKNKQNIKRKIEPQIISITGNSGSREKRVFVTTRKRIK